MATPAISTRSCSRLLHDFAEPLTVVMGRSRRLTLVLVAIHTLALAAAMLTAIGWVLKLGLVATVMLSAVVSFRRHVYIDSARGSGAAIVALREHAGEYSLRLRGTAAFAPAVLVGFTVLPFALLLEFKAATWCWSRTAMVFNDAVDSETFQHLRARLRLRGHRAAAAEAPSQNL